MAYEPVTYGGDTYLDLPGGKKFDKKWGTDEGLANLYEAYQLQQESGLGSETALMRKLKKAGLIDAEGNVIAPEGYAGTFDPLDPNFKSDPDQYRKALSGGGDYFRESVYTKQWDKYRAQLAKDKMDKFKKDTIDPLTGSVTTKLQELLDNPAIGPEELVAQRGEIVSMARAQEAERLKRIGASLGLRGLDPGSIAGAALVNQVAEETDRRISEGLRQFNFDVNALERQSEVSELGLATGLSTQLAQLETALTQGNLEQVFGISNDIAGIMEAINQQSEALKAQNKATQYGLYGAIVQGAGAAVPG